MGLWLLISFKGHFKELEQHSFQF